VSKKAKKAIRCATCKGKVGTRYLRIDTSIYCVKCALPSLMGWARKFLDQRRGMLVQKVSAGLVAGGPSECRSTQAYDYARRNAAALRHSQAAIIDALEMED